MELIEGSETSANHNRTPGKYPNESIQDSKHGESLKSNWFAYSLRASCQQTCERQIDTVPNSQVV
jgi:hypothetical protein